MFKKVNTTILIIILLVLLGVYLGVKYFDTSDRSFKEVVLTFDPSEINGIDITNPEKDEVINLVKEGGQWMQVKDERKYPADTNSIKSIIDQLGNLKTKRYAGKGEKAWEKYQVNDSLAIRIDFLADGKAESRIYIGRFSYTMPNEAQQQQQMMMGRQQAQGEMTTYVRLGEDNAVYAVDGFLRMNFNRDADSYRDKTITNLDKSDITRVVMDLPSGRRLLELRNGFWNLDGASCDSAKAANYVGTLASLQGNEFVPENLFSSVYSHRISIEGNNFLPVEVSSFPVSDTNILYAISSSHNPTAYFEGKESKLFERIFKEADEFTTPD